MPDPGIQQVAVSGITWTTVLVGLLNLLVGGALVSWIRSRPRLREIEKSADANLIEALSTRVDKLEQALTEQRDYYERKLDQINKAYDTDKRISRHELGNVKMRFKALIMLLKRLPDPPSMLIEILADIETMEAEQNKAEALEKGAQNRAGDAAKEGAGK